MFFVWYKVETSRILKRKIWLFMQRSTIRLIIFLLAFSTGLGVYFIYHFSVTHSISETITLPPSNAFLVSTVSKTENNLANNDSYNIAPCIGANPLEKSKFPKTAIRISRGIVNDLALCGSLPEYPHSAKTKRISGAVRVNVTIDESGEVAAANAIANDSLLRQRVEKATYQIRFAPTLLGGKSYRFSGTVIYQYESERGFWLPKNFPLRDAENRIIKFDREK